MLQPSSLIAGQVAAVRRIDCLSGEGVHSVCAIPHGETGFVVMATDGGVQVWDKPGLHLLFQWSFPVSDANSSGSSPAAQQALTESETHVRHQLFARSSTILLAADGSANICFGASSGDVHVLQVDELGRFQGPSTFHHHKAPITAMGSAYQSRHGRTAEDVSPLLLTADESGVVIVWKADSAESYKVVRTLGSATVPATSIAIRKDCAIVARLDGSVQVYGLKDGKLRAEIAAHSRWLTCMDIHPLKDIIVTGGEDGMIAVWMLPVGGQKAAVLLSTVWMHATVTGVAFCGPTFDDVAAVAFDTDELQLFKLLLPS